MPALTHHQPKLREGLISMVLRDLLYVFGSSREHFQSRLEPGKGCRKSDCMERLDTAQKGLVGGGRSSNFFKSTIRSACHFFL